MWVVAHAASGAAVGALVEAPELALPLAFVAHGVLDLVPHWDYTHTRRMRLWACLDVAASGLLVLVLAAAGAPWVVLVCAFLAALPDVDGLGLVIPALGRRHWYPSHWRRFPHGESGPVLGLVLQLAVVVLSLGAVTASLP
jgi:hypothetical protein